MTITKGSCHCGEITYSSAEDLAFQFICYCDNCRKLNGGSRMTAAIISRDSLQIHGQTSVYHYQGGKAPIDLHFCGKCSTPLFAFPDAAAESAVLRANSIDTPFEPAKAIFKDQICAWDTLLAKK